MGSLAQAMAYTNPDVVAKFRQTYPISQTEADDVFGETKKWLWLAAHTTLDEVYMSPTFWVVDEMWHTFILFTLDYTRYCDEQFGQYLHHVPTPPETMQRTRQQAHDDPATYVQEQSHRARSQYREIVHLLDEDTLRTWAVDYPRRYPPAVRGQLTIAGLEPEGPEQPQERPALLLESAPPRESLEQLHGDELIEQLVADNVDPEKIVPVCSGGSCGTCAFRCVCNKGPGEFVVEPVAP